MACPSRPTMRLVAAEIRRALTGGAAPHHDRFRLTRLLRSELAATEMTAAARRYHPLWTDVHDLGEYRAEDSTFLEPYPSEDPVARYEQRENVELAFVAALQKLSATQRSVLILREVLEFSAAEVAEVLDTTVASVNSALQRARKAVDHRIVEGTQAGELQVLGANGREELVTAFVEAWERSDVPALIEMLAEDARFAVSPFPAWFRGRADIGRFLAERTFAVEDAWRARPLMASGQLAIASYRRDADTGRFRLGALNVLTLRDGKIAEMHGFLDPATHRWFDVPAELAQGTDDKFSGER